MPIRLWPPSELIRYDINQNLIYGTAKTLRGPLSFRAGDKLLDTDSNKLSLAVQAPLGGTVHKCSQEVPVGTSSLPSS
ncbi:hypothetical protein CROQUDRAFT_95725 [Cronartium quercuum f. sp. fusiforme G11]|uniref:Uncharacterized protein n=1 Tax=Cronartium quercuum f. sp. fusiforme G11 TaxID=708437 RepID=A0A9P6T993_9BASI|nr:hypothetical protein CROQUDRAFT_95725 [Cronartium quercuum f. sp. fusiforme G11]